MSLYDIIIPPPLVVASSFLTEEKPPGNYSMSVKLDAQPNPDCDPTQGPCEMWLPGVYNVTFGKLSVCVRVCMKCELCITSCLSPL